MRSNVPSTDPDRNARARPAHSAIAPCRAAGGPPSPEGRRRLKPHRGARGGWGSELLGRTRARSTGGGAAGRVAWQRRGSGRGSEMGRWDSKQRQPRCASPAARGQWVGRKEGPTGKAHTNTLFSSASARAAMCRQQSPGRASGGRPLTSHPAGRQGARRHPKGGGGSNPIGEPEVVGE